MVPPFSAFRFHRFVLSRRTSRVLLSSHTSTFSGQGRGRRLGNMVAMPANSQNVKMTAILRNRGR